MQSNAKTVSQYINSLLADRKAAIKKLRTIINAHLPKGFKEGMGYGMMGWNVPFSVYPAGYHCDPNKPVPFMGLASQKQFVAFYHMGIYADPKLMKWFVGEYKKVAKYKLDMGKSCIRFRHLDDIPYKLIGQLVSKITLKQWVEYYQANDPRVA